MTVIFVFLAAGGCSHKDTVQLKDTKQHKEFKTDVPVNHTEELPDLKNKNLTDTSVAVVQTSETVAVYVCGAVCQTGVYELSVGSRIDDAVKAAGGMTGDAQADKLNLAQSIEDGQMIRVPYNGETEEIRQDMESKQPDGGEKEIKVNINRADAGQLKTIPGIGDAKALSIIRYRDEKGNFQSIEDIKNIEGIKDGVFQKIKDYICVK